MGLLNTYPILINNEPVLSPHSWTENSNTVETVNQTEAGTDQIDVTRLDKLSISVTYAIAETSDGTGWAKKFKGFSKLNSLIVKRYDILEAGYEERTMRMRNFSANLVPKSDYLPAVNGVWEISFTLEEF